MITFEVYHTPKTLTSRLTGRHQGWRWRATAANGEILAVSSESYTNQGDALKAIKTLWFAANSGQWRFAGPDGLRRINESSS